MAPPKPPITATLACCSICMGELSCWTPILLTACRFRHVCGLPCCACAQRAVPSCSASAWWMAQRRGHPHGRVFVASQHRGAATSSVPNVLLGVVTSLAPELMHNGECTEKVGYTAAYPTAALRNSHPARIEGHVVTAHLSVSRSTSTPLGCQCVSS